MAFLLKIKPSAIVANSAVVPKSKSAKLEQSSIGSDIYVWFGDQSGSKGALNSVSTLLNFEEIEMPQVRNPAKIKPGYRLSLAPRTEAITSRLSTDDLEGNRYSYVPIGLASLGKLHCDRNDKIIALSPEEANVLDARFR